MGILHLRTNLMIQSRMATVSGAKKSFDASASTVTSVWGTLQPLSQENAALADGVYGRTFQFFTDDTFDIQEGDRLKDSNGVYYRVKSGAVVRRSFNNIDYLKVICERI